jgi:hypothetical protein
MISVIAALTWVLGLSRTSTIGPPSCRWAASSSRAPLDQAPEA